MASAWNDKHLIFLLRDGIIPEFWELGVNNITYRLLDLLSENCFKIKGRRVDVLSKAFTLLD
jgi:hypothetical protein